jgi:hypothetical protein
LPGGRSRGRQFELLRELGRALLQLANRRLHALDLVIRRRAARLRDRKRDRNLRGLDQLTGYGNWRR